MSIVYDNGHWHISLQLCSLLVWRCLLGRTWGALPKPSFRAEGDTVRMRSYREGQQRLHILSRHYQNVGPESLRNNSVIYWRKYIHIHILLQGKQNQKTNKNCYNHKIWDFLQITFRGKALFYSVTVLWCPPQLCNISMVTWPMPLVNGCRQ